MDLTDPLNKYGWLTDKSFVETHLEKQDINAAARLSTSFARFMQRFNLKNFNGFSIKKGNVIPAKYVYCMD